MAPFRFRRLLAVLGLLAVTAPGAAQTLSDDFDRASHIVVPQVRAFDLRSTPRAGVTIDAVRAQVEIIEQLARTTLDVRIGNAGTRDEQAVVLLPVPAGAVVSGFDFQGSASEPTARILPAAEARRTYESIVARLRDPALLEFAGYGLLRSSVFPVPAGGAQRVRIVYEHVLPSDGNRVDYILPRSEALGRGVPWQIDLTLTAPQPISMVYSPSHDVKSERTGAGQFTVRVADAAAAEPGPFRLSYLIDRGGVSATLFAYPDPSVGGGFFLFTAGLPARVDTTTVPREVILVIDRSGSMAGGKLDQVRTAALQIIEGLGPDESFNIIDYGSNVDRLRDRPARRSDETIAQARTYLSRLAPTGGTNLHDALLEALRQPTREGVVPLVLFLTDGVPTIGKTRETDIRALVTTTNPNGRRVYTVGVGTDVNAPLLGRLAELSRGTATYVLPGEDVELAMATLGKRLHGPVLLEPVLRAQAPGAPVGSPCLREVVPAGLPDLFDGDRLVVLGKYTTEGTITFALDGTYLGAPKTFDFEFDLGRATTAHAFVPRLWASRSIAYLVDALRHGRADGAVVADESELIDEIVRLSTTYGVLTEYTAFLATEGTDLGNFEALKASCQSNVQHGAVQNRSGAWGVSQALNVEGQKQQAWLNRSNSIVNAQFDTVSTGTVQQMCDRTFFKRGVQWIDGRVGVAGQADLEPDDVIIVGTPEHFALARRLAAENRAGLLALDGPVLLLVDGRRILVTRLDGC